MAKARLSLHQQTHPHVVPGSSEAQAAGQPCPDPWWPCSHCKCRFLSTGHMSQTTPLPVSISVCPWTCPPVLSFHLHSRVTPWCSRRETHPWHTARLPGCQPQEELERARTIHAQPGTGRGIGTCSQNSNIATIMCIKC